MTDSQPPAPDDAEPEWEAHLGASPPDDPTAARDVFCRERKRAFLKALARGDTVTAAARAAGVSKQTVYHHQKRDPHFRAAWEAASKLLAPTIELAAFERAVTGVEEDVISYGRHVGTRVKRSDALLQTLLKGSNPGKYGPQAGAAGAKAKLKKKWRDKERKRLRAELIAADDDPDGEKALASIHEKLAKMRAWMIRHQGYIEDGPGGELIPPGWYRLDADGLPIPRQNGQA